MKKTLLFELLIFSGLILIACEGEGIMGDPTVVVNGTVIENTNSEPVVNAWYVFNDTINAEKRLTNSQGEFTWAAIAFIDGTLFIGKENYLTEKLEFDNLKDDSTGIEVRLKKISSK